MVYTNLVIHDEHNELPTNMPQSYYISILLWDIVTEIEHIPDSLTLIMSLRDTEQVQSKPDCVCLEARGIERHLLLPDIHLG